MADFSGEPNLNRSGDAVFSDNKLSLTKNTIGADGVGLNNSIGRAIYPEKFHLWDSLTNTAADFETNFTFTISMLNPPDGADGMAFFIAANNSEPLHPRTLGGCLGLIVNCSDHNVAGLVFVEFDTFSNSRLNDPSENHIGININSGKSVATQTWDERMKNGSEGHARVRYDSKTANLIVFLTYPSLDGSRSLSYPVNLSEVLPEWVVVGFSAATGTLIETHYVLSWGFISSISTELPIPEAESDHGGRGGQNIGAVIGGAVGGSVVLLGSVLIYLRRKREVREAEKNDCDDSIDHEFEHESGPRRLLDVADNKLCMEFDVKQMECLLIVGLWCAYPDYTFRPSIRQALQVLNFEAPLPNLPKKMPIPKYDAPSSSSNSSTGPFLLSDNSLATTGR
ncbi:hypothetical protein COLO4_32426 [Corchorus olitorius]|uniref:Legume lectin domain-containing protein n=1 Tax=Corchorus olitorius TaxID=93759 RepID=A0A1R3GZP4_9ROSI|nr:hypothetical protein COLO4_32426 [Corchorus olitorius]